MSRFKGYVERKIADITAYYWEFVGVGYPVEFVPAVPETLQVLTERDATNWLIVLGITDEALAVGMGDVTMGGPIICTSGNQYELTYAQAGWMIREMRAWSIAADTNWRALIRSARDCAKRSDLELIDITAGYP